GGCQWQMLPYHKQIEYKQQQVIDNLQRIGKIALPAVETIAGAPQDRFYRNKLEYTFSTREYSPVPPPRRNRDASGAWEPAPVQPPDNVLGFHARGFFDKIVNIEKCWLQEDLTNQLRNSIRAFAHANNFSFYDFREHRGMLRNLQVRLCTTGEVMINLVLGGDNEKRRKEILECIDSEFPQLTTIVYTINLKNNDSIFDLEPVIYKGKGYVVEKLEEFRFKIGPKSFFQTNTKQAETRYSITREFAELDGTQVVYDLYCGTGS